MTRVGTGFVEIKPDFSAFGKGFDEEIKARLRGVGQAASAGIRKELDKAVGGSTSKVKVDIDRNSLTRISTSLAAIGTKAFADITTAAGGIGGALTNAFSSLTSLGPLLTGAGIIMATVLAPAALAVAASLATAAAGAAALGIALAAAFGPVALVGVALLARVAVIVKDVAASQKASTAASATGAQALQGVRAASDQAAQAQENLATQLKAARQAQIDATEAVKDDRLARAQAEEGIVGARLSTRQAIKDLQDFRKQAGATGSAFAGVFKKFTDVNVDTSGLKGALAAAGAAAGSSLSGDQELELEQKIHAVREARLGEKAATDALHDSTVKLSRDRQTEADFLKRGANAYAPYRQAVEQVRQAQRGLETATRQANAGLIKQHEAFKNLTPAERKFGELLINAGKAIKAAFGPAVAAALDGLSKALKSGLTFLRDPKIASSLRGIGEAIGSAFATLGKEIARPETRSAFAEFAKAGARLVRIFGSKVFVSLERIFLRIARAALPALVSLVSRFADKLGGLEKGTRNTKKLKGGIDNLVDSFGRVLELGHQFGRVLLDVVGGATKSGDSLIVSLTKSLSGLADHLETAAGKKDLQNFFQKSADFARALGSAIVAAIPVVEALLNTFTFLVRHIKTVGVVLTAAVALFAPEIAIAVLAVEGIIAVVKHWDQILGAIKGTAKSVGKAVSVAFDSVKSGITSALNAVISTATGFYQRVLDVGAHLGRGLAHGIKAGLSSIADIGKTIINGLIEVLNAGFKVVNDAIPNKIPIPLGPDINLPDNPIPTIQPFARGGFVQGIGGTDSQLAALTPGEFVVNPTGVRTAGAAALLDLNRGRKPIGAELHLTQHIYTDDAELTATKAARRAMQAYETALDREP